jgi:tRNA(His) 5'-end guanylyltransferase
MKERTLGDRMKRYEMEEAGRRFMPLLPIMARLDGRAFHTFTRGLPRPYSAEFSKCMIRTTCQLVDKFNASLGYTQSDEISLLWFNNDRVAEMAFDGRYHKWVSLLASCATRQFGKSVDKYLPEKSHLDPEFDCRVWQLPNLSEVYNAFMWREDDATRNSLQLAAQSLYSHKQLHRKGGAELHDMLHAKGVNWNDYPSFFKRGTYVRRKQYEKTLTSEELKRMPVKHRATGPVIRSAIFPLDVPPIREALLYFFNDLDNLPVQSAETALYHPFHERA